MAMEEPHDSVLHDVTASILEESLQVKYKNKKSYLEPLKIQNSNDGPPKNANDVELADDEGDVMQKKELIHHLVDHQEHQEGKSLEECNIPPPTTTTTAAAAAATATSNDDSLMKRKISSNKESMIKMDYGHLNRGTCSSPNDACVPQNKSIEGNGSLLEPEDASYASSGYCVPLSFLEGMEYKNIVTTTMSLIDKEESNKEEEITDLYYHYHPQYDQHHRQLDSLNCTSLCPGPRLDVSASVTDDISFKDLINDCTESNGRNCPSDYPDISCWNTTGITDMSYAFDSHYGTQGDFNDPLECWDVGQVTIMNYMFFGATYFNQPIDSWDVSQVETMNDMFRGASDFNQCLSTWAGKTSDYVDTFFMLEATACPNGIGSPDATIGPWCQNYTQGCFAPSFEPSQQPSDLPSNSPTTKSQKKKGIKKTKKQDKKKSKKM